MSARGQWRYIAWTRALHRGDKIRAWLLDKSRDLDNDRDESYPLTCRLLDHLAGGIGPR